MASTRGPRRLPVRGEFKSGDNSTGSQFASVIPGKLLHPKKNLLLVEVSPNHINKSFKLPILITYAFRNALLMDGNSCRSHSGPHAHGPGPRQRASLLPRTAPSGRSTRPGLRGLQGGGVWGACDVVTRGCPRPTDGGARSRPRVRRAWVPWLPAGAVPATFLLRGGSRASDDTDSEGADNGLGSQLLGFRAEWRFRRPLPSGPHVPDFSRACVSAASRNRNSSKLK